MEGHVALEPAAEDASGGTSQLGHTGTESGLDSGYLSANRSASSDDRQTLSVAIGESLIESYRMNRTRRGRLLVICNSEFKYGKSATLFPRLDGFRKNIESLRETFQQSLRFEWNLKENLTGYQMFDAIDQASAQDHSDCDCFMVVVLTHEHEKGTVAATDEGITIQELVKPLKTCKSLAGKPKMIFIQARSEKDSGMHEDAVSGENRKPAIVIPMEADFLYVYSTADEYVSTDNPDRGTWFIQALCAEFKANWKSLEIIEMLTRVCRKLASVYESMPSAHKRKQLTAVTSTLTKALKFLQ